MGDSHPVEVDQAGLQVSDDVTITWMELLHRPVAVANALKRRLAEETDMDAVAVLHLAAAHPDGHYVPLQKHLCFQFQQSSSVRVGSSHWGPERTTSLDAPAGAVVHAGVSSDARAGCGSEGWTSDVYQRVFLAAPDAIIWQSANRHRGDPALPLHVQNELQPRKETLDGCGQALTLWQHKLMQAVIAQAPGRLSVLATAWSGGVAQMPEVCIQCSNKHQSVTVQELESVHILCSGTLAIVLEGQQVFVQQMDPGRLQLTLQLVRKRTLRIATATAMQFIPGKDCCQVSVMPWWPPCTS
eukprot:jgi/Astpho2/3492/Aster-08127